ncbi:hypothetical protein GCM10009722_03330 [Williamsia deligens]
MKASVDSEVVPGGHASGNVAAATAATASARSGSVTVSTVGAGVVTPVITAQDTSDPPRWFTRAARADLLMLWLSGGVDEPVATGLNFDETNQCFAL